VGAAPSAANVSRSAGTWRVLISARAYAVALGALASAMLQVSVMILLPSLLATGHGFTGPQSALVIVFAMLTNLSGALLIVTTRLRHMPTIALSRGASPKSTGPASAMTTSRACEPRPVRGCEGQGPARFAALISRRRKPAASSRLTYIVAVGFGMLSTAGVLGVRNKSDRYQTLSMV